MRTRERLLYVLPRVVLPGVQWQLTSKQYGSVNEQVQRVSEQLANITELAGGFDAMGFSQGTVHPSACGSILVLRSARRPVLARIRRALQLSARLQPRHVWLAAYGHLRHPWLPTVGRRLPARAPRRDGRRLYRMGTAQPCAGASLPLVHPGGSR